MQLPPRAQDERLLSTRVLALAMLWYGMIEGTAGLAAYFFCNAEAGWPLVPLALPGTAVYRGATTMTLATIIATQAGVACSRVGSCSTSPSARTPNRSSSA